MNDFVSKGFKLMPAIQGLRAIAFICVFLHHSGIELFVGPLGPFGVSVFIILSGFLMGAKHISNDTKLSFSPLFSIRKIIKLYPLHIITMVMCIVYLMVTSQFFGNTKLALQTFLHTLLIQIWQPDASIYCSLNGPSWYLAICVLTYLLFPFILFFMKKYKSRRTAFIVIIASIIAILLFSAFAKHFGASESDEFMSSQYLTYYFPPARLPEFIIGCNMGYLFVTERKISPKKINIISALALAACFLSFFIFDNGFYFLSRDYFKFTALFLLPSSLLIYSVSHNCYLSELLKKDLVVLIGNLSSYAFLIHYPIIIFISYYFKVYHSDFRIVLFDFIITLLLSYLYMIIIKRIKQKRILKGIG